jgi:hypothetical protein
MENTQFQNISFIRAIPLPPNSDNMRGYQCLPYMTIIDSIKEELDKQGISIINENYKIAKDGKQVYGNIITDMNVDGEMAAAIHWVSSYNKSKRFEINASALVLVCTNGMMRQNTFASAKRKHVGTIEYEVPFMIEEAVQNLEKEYMQLIEAKRHLESIETNQRLIAEIGGRLFLEESLLSPTQLSRFKSENERKTNPFNNGNVWGLYNNLTESLKLSHPTEYMDNHIKLHEFMMNEF